MDLTQLEMFNAVAEAGSITRAAAKVHRVPSNLTTRLRQLETELGLICLFARISVYVSRLPGITFYAIANKFSH